MQNLIQNLDEAQPVLARFVGDDKPVAGIILGSGLNHFADGLTHVRVLPFAKVPHMETSTADGHRALFVMGRVPDSDGVPGPWVLCMQGRLHCYEGFTPQQVAFPVWLMHRIGIDTIITTNAAGAINPSYQVGDFCLMADQINMTGGNPIVGVEPNLIADRFVPMLNAFDSELRACAHAQADRLGIRLQEGVYLALLGPSFETPAEIRCFAGWGADTVAMSVVEEVIAARHVGMRVLGMSLISNMACGVQGADPTGDEIMEVAVRREDDFKALVNAIVNNLP